MLQSKGNWQELFLMIISLVEGIKGKNSDHKHPKVRTIVIASSFSASFLKDKI